MMQKNEIFVDSPKQKCSRCGIVDNTLGKFSFWHCDVGYEYHWICLDCFRKVMEYLGFKK